MRPRWGAIPNRRFPQRRSHASVTGSNVHAASTGVVGRDARDPVTAISRLSAQGLPIVENGDRPTGRIPINPSPVPGQSANPGISSAFSRARVVLRGWATRTQISATGAPDDADTRRTPAVPTPATAMPRGSAPSPRRSATTPPKPGRS